MVPEANLSDGIVFFMSQDLDDYTILPQSFNKGEWKDGYKI